MAIASCSAQCLRSFEHLAEEARRLESESPLSASAIGDELGRFKVWAGNIGALQRDSTSLDYRLREASQIVHQVTKILQHLELSLLECIEIVSGHRAQKQGKSSDEEALSDEFSDISDSDSSEGPEASAGEPEPVMEIFQLFSAVTEATTSLYKLSIAIRRPTPRDRYAKAASSTPFDASYDVGHVYEKFPHVRSKAWLIDKLGSAITRRREFLRYRENHRGKLGGSNKPSADFSIRRKMVDAGKIVTNETEFQTPGLETQSTSYSQLASTKATTYVADLNDEFLDIQSTADRSDTSYVTSIAEEDSDNMRQIPEPPKESANGMPFECPYCFTIQSVKSSKHWRRHLLSDLKPYICTFEDCSAQMFERRQMWFQHELDKHRKGWRCNFCSCQLFASVASLESHIQEEHSEYTKQQTSSLISLCEQMPEAIAASACPFCDWDARLREKTTPTDTHTAGTSLKPDVLAVTPGQFERHVGNHLEHLALFAIPPPMKESSGASSNEAAASHLSDLSIKSDTLSEVSSAHMDQGKPPKLYEAVMSGDIKSVMREVRNGADLTLRYGEYGNVLQAAAVSLFSFPRDEMLRTLLEHGADANMRGGIYGNALQAVAANPSVSDYPGMSDYGDTALGVLLDRGAEVNAAGGKYGHVLVAATAMPMFPSLLQEGRNSMRLAFLLDQGADPNALGSKHYASALHQAIGNRDVESVRLLLVRGASLTVHHEVYGTPIHQAKKIAYEPILSILRKFSIPAFLRQSQNGVRAKFNDLAWKEKLRILQGRNDPSSQWVQDKSPYILKRNRYGNVQPWDKSRIHLNVAKGESDYINASPILLRNPPKGVEMEFIATQGPKQSTMSHFWHMIWQQTSETAVIVMLTQTHDGTTEKCFQYFPLSVEAGSIRLEPLDRETYAPIENVRNINAGSFKTDSLETRENSPEGSVTLLEYLVDEDLRTEIRNLCLRFGAETKNVWHLLFLGWPDFAVPEDGDRVALLKLLKLSAEKNTSPSSPRIIHSSAGVGRTGTFIALDYLLTQVKSDAILDVEADEDRIYDVVDRLREQRMLMVQMEAQYQFLYDIVREQLIERYPNLLEQRSLDLLSQSSKENSDTAKDNHNNDEHGGLDNSPRKQVLKPRRSSLQMG